MALRSARCPETDARVGRSNRSRVAALADSTRVRTVDSSVRCPWRSRAETSRGRSGFWRFPHSRAGGFPEHDERLTHRLIVQRETRMSVAPAGDWPCIEQSYDMLAVVPGHRDELI